MYTDVNTRSVLYQTLKYSHRWHEGVQDTDREGRAAGERLCQVQLRVRIVVVVLIKELNVAVVDKLCEKNSHVTRLNKAALPQEEFSANLRSVWC